MGNFENDLRNLIEEWRGRYAFPESMAAALCDAAAELTREAVDRQVAARDANVSATAPLVNSDDLGKS